MLCTGGPEVLCTGGPEVLCTGGPEVLCTGDPEVLCTGGPGRPLPKKRQGHAAARPKVGLVPVPQ